MPDLILIPDEDPELVVQRFHSKERPPTPAAVESRTYSALPASITTIERVSRLLAERPDPKATSFSQAFDTAFKEDAKKTSVMMPRFYPSKPIQVLTGVLEVPRNFLSSKYGRRHELWVDDTGQKLAILDRQAKKLYVFDDIVYGRATDYLRLASGRKVPAHTAVDIIAMALLSTVRP